MTSIITQRHTRRVVFMSSPGSVGEGRSSVFVILGLSCARGATVVCRTALAHGRRHWPGAGRVFGLRRRVPLVRARRPRAHPPHCTQETMIGLICLYEYRAQNGLRSSQNTRVPNIPVLPLRGPRSPSVASSGRYPGFCTRAFEMLQCRTVYPAFNTRL